jgi:minor extracellular serine protease Vpr
VPANWNGNPGLGLLDNVNVQGAGLAHIDRTIQNAVSVAPGKIATGDASGGPFTQTLTFTNHGASAVTYNLSHASALTTGPNQLAAVSEFARPASVSFSAPSITVPAGGSASVNATITAPAIPSLFNYGGYLVATPVGGALPVRVPYMGLSGNYQDLNVLSARSSGFPRLTHGDIVPVTDGAVFNLTSGDFPTILFQLDSSTRNLSAEVYAVSGSTLGRDWHKAFSFDFVPRNTSASGLYAVPFDGTTSNGRLLSTLPPGKYAIVLTALQPLGDASNPASVETWQSPVFEIQR